MAKILQNNKIAVDKYLSMEYNNCLEKLVMKDSDVERGKALFIKELLSLMKNVK